MLVKTTLQIPIVQAALLLGSVQARIWLLERDGRATYPRGLGQEQPATLRDVAAPCTGETCDTLNAQDSASDRGLLFDPAIIMRRQEGEPTGNFGSCSVPEIEFGQGYDGRKETSFRPVDQNCYKHNSADDIETIARFMCDQLASLCGADVTACLTCKEATTFASSITPAETGAQADAFNFVFGIGTSYSDAPVYDNQGNLVSANGN